jgi:hypothetical protein
MQFFFLLLVASLASLSSAAAIPSVPEANATHLIFHNEKGEAVGSRVCCFIQHYFPAFLEAFHG